MKGKLIKSNTCIKNLKPNDKKYFVPVAGCKKLSLVVDVNTPKTKNRKSWKIRFKSPETFKETSMSLGKYPDLSLAEAKDKLRDAEKLLAQGVDPKLQRQRDKDYQKENLKNTFNVIADLHLESIKINQKETTIKRKKGRYTLLCSYLGDRPINDIKPSEVYDVLMDISNKSRNSAGKPTDKAERCAGIASEIFDFAFVIGKCESNPAKIIKGQLPKYKYNHRSALVKPKDFGKLLQDIEKSEASLNTLNSLRLLALLFIRNGDLRRVKWTDLDLEEGIWELEPMKSAGRLNMVKKMVIPLSKQAINIFKEQKRINGNYEYVFYSPNAIKNKIISENTAGNLLNDLGYKNIHCPHGFRASARTILCGNLKYPEVIVEMALGHMTKQQNGHAYGRYEFFDERKEMMQVWANYIDEIKMIDT